MTRRKRFRAEFKREALRRADEPGVTDVLVAEELGIIASMENPAAIQKILAHLANPVISAATALLPDCPASLGLPAGIFD